MHRLCLILCVFVFVCSINITVIFININTFDNGEFGLKARLLADLLNYKICYNHGLVGFLYSEVVKASSEAHKPWPIVHALSYISSISI